MLHIIAEIGKPGKTELERRHFPHLTNKQTLSAEKARCRRYIPHGYGEDYEFNPHPPHIEPKYSDCGPDWKSRLRYLPAPHNPNYIVELWPEPWKPLRTGYNRARRTNKEWALYPEGYDATLRCSFDGVHKATETTSREITDSMRLGRAKVVQNKRNSLPMASPGDKSYQAVEYSLDFHRYGSTLPLVNFGGHYKPAVDTFVPLEGLPPLKKEQYKEREMRRQMEQDIDNVKYLERWRPATPLIATNNTVPALSFKDPSKEIESMA